MSLRRRLALLEWARRSQTLIFEDDYDSEYRYSGRPLPALQGLDRGGVVIFAGSFNEVLFPALRLGYLVVSAGMVDRFAAAQSVSMRHALGSKGSSKSPTSKPDSRPWDGWRGESRRSGPPLQRRSTKSKSFP